MSLDAKLLETTPAPSGVTLAACCSDAATTLRLAGPIFIGMVCWVTMKTTDTALLGHAGNTTKYLDASALSDLWMSSTGVFIQGGVLGVFCAQAFGAGNKQLAGVWLQVSLLVLSMAAIPVVILWTFTGPALRLTGLTSDPELASLAAYYAHVFLACIPMRVLRSQVLQYFSAQKIVGPQAVIGTTAMLANLLLGLTLVLGVPMRQFGWTSWRGFGFVACPLVTAGVEFAQVLLLMGVYWWGQGLYKACWPEDGWSWSHVTRERVVAYVKMYVPAALSIASDFWRVSVIGWVAARMSPVDVGAFNASYRVWWMCLMFSGSMASATGIQLGGALGKGDTTAARRVTAVGTAMTVLALGGLAAAVFFNARRLGHIFSDDPEFLNLFEEVRLPLVLGMVFMNMAVFLEKVPYSMGRTTTVLYAGLAGSWLGQVPGVILCTRFWRNDLYGVYMGCAGGYALLCTIFTLVIVCTDWDARAREAQERSEVKSKTALGGQGQGGAKGSVQ